MNRLLDCSLGLIAVAALAAAACAFDAGTEQDTGEVGQALLNQDTFGYLRCNSTGFSVGEANRLKSTSDPYLFSVIYRVTEPWMVQTGEQCTVTETDQLNGWGTWQKHYMSRANPVIVPGGGQLALGGSFTVKYPALGAYKAVVNWRDGAISIAAAPPEESWEPCQVTTLANSPAVPSRVFVGCANGDVFTASNGLSATPAWVKIDEWSQSGVTYGLPNLPVNAVAVSPTDASGKTAYVAVAGSKQGYKLWKTVTGGQSWINLSQPFAEIWGLSVNPLDANKVYATGPGGTVQMSPDGGATWTGEVTAAPLAPPIAAGDKLSAVTYVNGKSMIWVGTAAGDVFMASTASMSWTKVDQPGQPGAPALPGRTINRLSAPIQGEWWPPFVYAAFTGMSNDSVWLTANGGQSWSNKHNPALPTTPVVTSSLGMYGVSANPLNINVLYVSGAYGVGRSADSGASWAWTAL